MTLTLTLRKIANGFVLSDGVTETYVPDARTTGVMIELLVGRFDETVAEREAAQREQIREMRERALAHQHNLSNQIGIFGQGQNTYQAPYPNGAQQTLPQQEALLTGQGWAQNEPGGLFKG